MTTISASTVLSSQHAQRADTRLTTLLLRYPRWIHAEGRTHRVISIDEGFEILIPTPGFMASPELSKNAASSRAIPVQKLVDDILADPAVPLFWGKNISGMQAKEELPPNLIEKAKSIWLQAMNDAIQSALDMSELDVDFETGKTIGAHKQIINRMLEPYSHITVLASATEWDNFLDLRDHGDAEPHINLLAKEVRRELDKPAMQILQIGQWHTPFVTRDDVAQEMLKPYLDDSDNSGAGMSEEELTNAMISKSVSCCASTSYKTVDGFDMTLDRAVALYDKLVTSTPIHASPCEHVAQADEFLDNIIHYGWCYPNEHRNFVGFRQRRAQIGA